MFARKISNDPLCPGCRLEVETVGHALWRCSAARDVWLEGTVRVQKSYSEEHVFSQILLKLSERLTMNEFELIVCVARQIWLRRNKWIFEGQFIHP